jgi:hypothetical protein
MSAMRKPSLVKRIRAKKKTPSTVVGVAWYTEENWSKVKAVATDPERFEETYAGWSAMAIEAVVNLKKAGVNAVKFSVLPNELLAWCLAHNKPNNAASRAEFVSEKLRSQSEADA